MTRIKFWATPNTDDCYDTFQTRRELFVNDQEDEKRKLAQKDAEDERKKRHIKEEYQREKVDFFKRIKKKS